MGCFRPITGYRGSNGMVFKRSESTGIPLTVSCGTCIGCKLDRSKQWAVRCMHEVQTTEAAGRPSCFITLTYAPEHLPPNGELRKQDFQKFMKKVRKKHKCRYYHCGEYGENTGRPHYHAIIFGWDFKPWTKVGVSPAGYDYFQSDELTALWKKGLVSVGNVTFESAAYVARYIMKKQYGNNKSPNHAVVDTETGELLPLQEEYTTMSLKPAIGLDWLKKYHKDVYSQDFCVINSPKGVKKIKPPRYYDKVVFEHDPELGERIKLQRKKAARVRKSESTPERLATREKVLQIKANKLHRSHDAY